VGKATWFAIQAIYAGVKRLNELDSEGIRLEEITKQYPQLLQPHRSVPEYERRRSGTGGI
jgi:hypothetical protein